jgi:hypothetical protein
MAEISILKNGDEVATADRVAGVAFSKPIWEGIKTLSCFYFNRLSLSPPVTFRHLAGEALIKFLDNTTLVIDDAIHEPMRYVHGRSEVMKGKHEVTAVLLAKMEGFVEPLQWMSYLPDIYQRFMAEWSAGSENA